MAQSTLANCVWVVEYLCKPRGNALTVNQYLPIFSRSILKRKKRFIQIQHYYGVDHVE